MSEAEWRGFVMQGTRTAKVATTRRDGRPHVVPVWFVLDDADLVFATAADSIKARTLRRDPRVSVCVDLEESPFGFVVIDGVATLDATPENIAVAYRKIAARYGGSGDPSPTGDPYNRGAGLLVRVVARHVVAVSFDR
jgi:PPOX class probable F420-dependent enzyme